MTATILVVDDEPDLEALVRQRFRRKISDGAVTFVFARDGIEALQSIADHPNVDMVVSDINMPRMDGLTLIRELRMLPAYKTVPMLVLTTESTPDKKLLGKEAGATGWLVKPFNPQQLMATIARVM